jgi:hypothetical protein
VTSLRALVAIVTMACSSCGGGSGAVAQVDCPFVAPERFGTVISRAIDGLAATTAEDEWSSVCAQVWAAEARHAPYKVTVAIAWYGTLDEYASLPGATPLDDLADEAYVLDAGRQLALRSGELVAVVTTSRAAGSSAATAEALGRRVAELLHDCDAGAC